MRNVAKTTTLEIKFPLLAVEYNCILSKDADITACFEVRLPELFTVASAEYEAIQTAVLVEYRQGVDLVVPNDVVCFGKGEAVFSFDELVNRGHEVLDLFRSVHAADSVVTAGYDADHLAGRGAVFGDGDGGMTCLCLEGEDVSKSVFRRKVGVARNKSCFLSFNSGNHGCFIFRGLGSIDERNAAVSCEFNGHFFTRY